MSYGHNGQVENVWKQFYLIEDNLKRNSSESLFQANCLILMTIGFIYVASLLMSMELWNDKLWGSGF